MKRVTVQSDDFDAGAELSQLARLGGGAVASFIGIVRGDGGLSALQLEHYPAMTQAALEQIADQALTRWPLLGVTVIHRYGQLAVGAQIVLVATVADQRAPALAATAYLIDWLKTRAPFWKCEHFADGRQRWVEARTEDEIIAARWD
jgi:molybdopterin synthase catalytic subunit